MTNELRERLEALSAGATQGEWRNVEAHPAYIRADAGLTITGNGYRRSDAALNAKLCMTLVNAFRSGDLVTRQEMEEAVAKAVAEEREACAELCEERAEVLDDMGIEMECCVGTANNCADDIRARSEQKEGE